MLKCYFYYYKTVKKPSVHQKYFNKVTKIKAVKGFKTKINDLFFHISLFVHASRKNQLTNFN